MIKTIFLTNAEVVAAGKIIYEQQIRQLVETPENIGKMLTLNIETGEYSIGDNLAETILTARSLILEKGKELSLTGLEM